MTANDAARATAEGMPETNRRRFLLNSVMAGAAVAVATPAAAAEPEMTPYEQAWWHVRELERLASEDGGTKILIFVHAEYGPKDFRSIGVNAYGQAVNDGMFAQKGGAK